MKKFAVRAAAVLMAVILMMPMTASAAPRQKICNVQRCGSVWTIVENFFREGCYFNRNQKVKTFVIQEDYENQSHLMEPNSVYKIENKNEGTKYMLTIDPSEGYVDKKGYVHTKEAGGFWIWVLNEDETEWIKGNMVRIGYADEFELEPFGEDSLYDYIGEGKRIVYAYSTNPRVATVRVKNGSCELRCFKEGRCKFVIYYANGRVEIKDANAAWIDYDEEVAKRDAYLAKKK